MPDFQTTSVPAFQDAFVQVMSARPNLQDVSCVIGPPSPGVAQAAKWLALLDVVGSEKWAAMGRLSKEENYNQTIYISVITRDGESDATAGRDVAYAIRAEVSEQLREDATLNDVVWQCQIEGDNKFEPRLGITTTGPDGKPVVDLSWREAALYFDVSVKYRMLRSS